MRAAWTRHLLLALTVGFAAVARADDPKSPPDPKAPPVEAPATLPVEPPPLPPDTQAGKAVEPADGTKPMGQPSPDPEVKSAASVSPKAKAESAKESEPPKVADDAAAERAAIAEKVKSLPKAGDKDESKTNKLLRETLEDRVKSLDEWGKAVKDRSVAENPEPRPEKLADEWKAALERAKAAIADAAKDPNSLMPADLRSLPAVVPDPLKAELKDAIDDAQKDLKSWSEKLEQLRADLTQKGNSPVTALRTRRDKQYQKVGGLKARLAEKEKAVSEAKTPEARELARERLVNQTWESRVETERLKALDAQIILESSRTDLSGLNVQMTEAHVSLAQKTLDRLKACHRGIAAREERELHKAAVQEKSIAKQSDDPVERYRAKRSADLLELKAKVIASDNLLATSPAPSLDEQRALADKAQDDFNQSKKLLDDSRVSHLEALRMTNDFRRISEERSRTVQNELAVTTNRLRGAENALSLVELEMIYDARDDRYELEALLDRIPKAKQPRALTIFNEIEARHTELLARRRATLIKLAERAESTHDQVLRRLGILDDHYGFIRTHIFWLRDEEPISMTSAAQVQREFTQVVWAIYRVGEELTDRSAWGRVTPEFMAAVFGLVVLPWPIKRLSRRLKSLNTPPARPGKSV